MTRISITTKSLTLALALSCAQANAVPSAFNKRDNFQQRTIERARVQRNMEYNQVKDMLIQTQAMLDALQIQLNQASEEVRRERLNAARHEFNLPRGVISSLDEALAYSRRYLFIEEEILALEIASKNEKPSLETKRKLQSLDDESKKLRVKGQKSMKKFHKQLKTEELQSVRNWITISEGILIRESEQAALAANRSVSAAAAAPEAASATSKP